VNWAAMLANWRQNFFGWNAANFGWGADRIQNILWRIQNGELDGVNPKAIVILAGNGFSRLWATARSAALLRRDPAATARIPLAGRRPAHDAGFHKTPATHCSRQRSRIARVGYAMCATV